MTNSIRTLIIDDEPGARATLKSYLGRSCPEIAIAGEGGSVKEAIELVEREKPDLVFLDVHMPDGDGFNLLERLVNIYFDVIFTSGFDQYAIKAIKYAAVDYLLKPLVEDELRQAVTRVAEKRKSRHSVSSKIQETNRIAVPDTNGLKVVHLDTIIYCKAEGSYSNFALTNQPKIVVCRTLKDYETILPNPPFMRIHNSSIINIEHVKSYVKGRGGQVEMSNGDFLDVARNRKQQFLDTLTHGE